ncbi:protein translocase subunit SecF [Kutzneria kofuensis]|uniref:Protein-export membrane protein SecF n=1 Tax=Kutzneria kofuensis TaxID=103725 RepID=A0A7W9KDB7_9PSEU|nr:protein translocase subunit SecF [Kutzneria kofuensis]MBB5889699.1 preprotein translocase subunit SecF [Kutzneria kofuensis]
MSTPTPVTPQPRHGLLHNLYVGTGAFDIIGKRKRWYIAFAVVIAICLGSMAIRGFNYGIEFTGGTQIQMPVKGQSGNATVDGVLQVYKQTLGRDAEQAQTVGSGNSETVQLRSVPLDGTQVVKLKEALFAKFKPLATNGQPSQQAISDSAVSSSWGGEISRQALIALAVFLVLVTIFLAFYFERAMAAAALASLANDLIVTAGVYSIIGFEVTPATVIGFLTILGFSLYDTVVVFDKVRENTRGLLKLTRRTYGEAANLAVNQTLMRSINTSLIALLPVLGLLVVGVVLLGVGTLQDLALIQLTGMLVGAVSSIFLATPLVVDLKMRDPKYKLQAERVAARRANLARKAQLAAQGVEAGEDFDPADDEALAAEIRKEKAMAAAASTPSRTPKARPSGKSGRPSGKRRH